MALTALGEATAAQIAKKADLPRTTTISILAKLAADNYLTTHRYRGVTNYWIESPRAIASKLETQVKLAEQLDGLLGDLYRSESRFPHAQVFDTKTTIRNFIEKAIAELPKKSVIYTIDTPASGNYNKIYSDQISNTLLSKKMARGIITKTLVPHGSIAAIPPQKLALQNIELRELPAGVSFQASLWLMGDMVVHFSGRPPFVVAIRHPLIHASTKTLYDYLWQQSE
jgi:sugar-specific transcriptional regulator TrmB